MQRFEYLTVYINPSGTYQSADGTWKNLQVLGEQGWELVRFDSVFRMYKLNAL